MSAPVETPAPPEVERRCPRCGAFLRADQEWCLSCGTEVGARVASPPNWRTPLLVLAAVSALLAIALVLVLVEASDDTEPVTQTVTPPAATPSPAPPVGSPTPAPTTSPVPEATPTIPPASDPGTAGGDPATGGAALTPWPAGATAWTIVLATEAVQADAEQRASDLVAQGTPAGVLDTDEYRGLPADRFLAFTGQYGSRREAQQALDALGDAAQGASVDRIVPR